MMEEAGVNLNELSPETLKSYINKSARSAADLSHTAGEYDAMADDNDFSGYAWKKKAGKRLRGIRRATEKLPESYTLEEWMGMLEEAGYDVSEYSLWRPKESGAKSTGVMKDPKKPKTPPAERDARNDPSSEFSKGLAAWLRAKKNSKLS